MLALALLSLLTSVVALVLAGMAWRRTPGRATGADDAVPADVLGLRREVAALAAESKATFRHLSVVRYDAFGDMGGHLSWSLALLDDAGDGVVLTSIHGRSDARTYAKSVSGWASEAQLSPEEQEAIASARPKT
ncbi:Protein of unknown function [Nocardioides terrae]|uniref:DUF4446 family protein n=1 Tax=Nocardioides terrae TaxID=574651 RepID=A0A1I1F3X6_9ACTN|nr:DUF4446 family protein [Nocardioides terrae]SFB94085.1 Protein of unknown function [Nocardioides terrae]